MPKWIIELALVVVVLCCWLGWCLLEAKPPTLPKTTYDPRIFRTGDLVWVANPHLLAVHPGHLGLVVRGPFDQPLVWELDNYNRSNILQPLRRFFKERLVRRHLVAWRRLVGGPPLDFARIKPHTFQTKYQYAALVQHAGEMLARHLGLPVLPITPSKGTCPRMYCSEFVLRVLVDLGVFAPSVLKSISTEVFAPDLALTIKARPPYRYEPARYLIATNKPAM